MFFLSLFLLVYVNNHSECDSLYTIFSVPCNTNALCTVVVHAHICSVVLVTMGTLYSDIHHDKELSL